MWTDVVDLRDFYASPLGAIARRMIRRRVREIWPDCKGQRVMGLGYCTPYLGLFQEESERTIAFMPAQQGVLHWPTDSHSQTCLVEENELPLDDLSMDRVLLVHALESSEGIKQLLREIWRVLDGSGKIMIVVPNRRGVWARFERTPFGWGRPYSQGQLNRLLRESMFTPTKSERALYMPPFQNKLFLSSAKAMENVGYRFFPAFAGVCIIEATKQIYAGNPKSGVRARAKALVSLPTRSNFRTGHLGESRKTACSPKRLAKSGLLRMP